MTMPSRTFEAQSSYRYGFNGQEKADEIFEGSTTALFWEYDSRTGRRWNVDPVVKTWESPYLCLAASPIWASDPDGDDNIYRYTGGNKNYKGPMEVRVKTSEHGDRHFFFRGFIPVGGQEIDFKNLKPENMVLDCSGPHLLEGHKGYTYDQKTDQFVKYNKNFTPETLAKNTNTNATNNKVVGSPTQNSSNTNNEKPKEEKDKISKPVQDAFDYAGAVATISQGVGSGFLRAYGLHWTGTNKYIKNYRYPVGIPNSLKASSYNVFRLGYASKSTVFSVVKASRIIDLVSKPVAAAAGAVNILKDGKLTVGDAGVAALTTFKILNPAFGFATGVYDIFAKSFGWKTSDDLVHDAIDYFMPKSWSWKFW